MTTDRMTHRAHRTARGLAVLAAALAAFFGAARPAGADAFKVSAEVRRGTRTNEAIGSRVATAGDVNGDGYSDLLVAEGFIDRGAVWCYHGAATPNFTTHAWTIAGAGSEDLRGCDLAPAGDVNGDGFGDVIVGAPLFVNGESSEGAVYIYLGSASGLAATPQLLIEGNAAIIGGGFGSSVDAAGDVNGDGFDDIVIGSPNFANGQTFEGQARVYPGSASGVAASPLWSFESDASGGHFGQNVTGAGDVNADGFDDLVVSAPDVTNGNTTEGRVYLFLGSASGPVTTPTWTYESNVNGGRCGFGLGMAGDLNGDGYSDIAFDTGTNNPATGGVLVFLGGAGIPAAAADRFYPNNGGGFADILFTAGDVNGDGCADLVANNTSFNSNTGQITILGGSEAGTSLSVLAVRSGSQSGELLGGDARPAGDVNGDGFGDVIVGSPLFDVGGVSAVGVARLYYGWGVLPGQTQQWSQDHPQSDAHYATAIAQGDWNGDGFGDVAIGCPEFNTSTVTDRGFAQVYYGGESIYAESSSWYDFGPDNSGRFGFSVANAGDVNNDGYDDLVVGAYDDASGGTAHAGAAFLYLGSASGLATNPVWSQGGGSVPGHYGWCVAGAGDVNGDGYADILVSEPDYNLLTERGGRAHLYFGGPAGPSANPDWSLAGSVVGDKLGYCVAGAGDVNGDGFDDFIVGTPGKENTLGDEGILQVFFGGATVPTGSWTLGGDQVAANYGKAAARAGDVNGDGFGDIVVGVPNFDAFNGVDRGTAMLYLGGPTNTLTLNWQEYGMFGGDTFGTAVSGGGDVNNDGYSDIAVGSPLTDFGATNAGGAYIRLGGPTGVTGSPGWLGYPTDDQSQYGAAVSLTGDASGDGFADLCVGQPRSDNGGGRAWCYFGGREGTTTSEVAGVLRKPMQFRSDGVTPIALGGRSDDVAGFDFSVFGRSAKGRSAIRTEYQVAIAGSGWAGAPLAGPAFDTGVPVPGLGSAATLQMSASNLQMNKAYHWRVRFLGDSPYFPSTSWFSPPGNGAGGTDLRLANPTGIDAPGPAAAMPLSAPRVGPNPCRDEATIWFAMPEAGRARLTVYDVSGRRVASLLDGSLGAGPQTTAWDTRDESGRRVAAGIYLLELERGSRSSATKIVVRR